MSWSKIIFDGKEVASMTWDGKQCFPLQLDRLLKQDSYEVIEDIYGKVVIKYKLSFENTDELDIDSSMLYFHTPYHPNVSCSFSEFTENSFVATFITTDYVDVLSGDAYIDVTLPETTLYSEAVCTLNLPITLKRGAEDPVAVSLICNTVSSGAGFKTVKITPPNATFDMTLATVSYCGWNYIIDSTTKEYIQITMTNNDDYETDQILRVVVPATKNHPSIVFDDYIWITGKPVVTPVGLVITDSICTPVNASGSSVYPTWTEYDVYIEYCLRYSDGSLGETMSETIRNVRVNDGDSTRVSVSYDGYSASVGVPY